MVEVDLVSSEFFYKVDYIECLPHVFMASLPRKTFSSQIMVAYKNVLNSLLVDISGKIVSL